MLSAAEDYGNELYGMYYTLGWPCWKCHALGLLLFTSDVELIIMKLLL